MEYRQGVLTYNDICKLVSKRVISGANRANVNGSSLDITLGDRILAEGDVKPLFEVKEPEFRPWTSSIDVIDFRRRDSWPSHEVILDPEEGYLLRPGEFILAASRELFDLPLTLSADYKLKSSMARIGLQHLNAGWCDPGWSGSALTMELVNVGRNCSIRIRPGDRIGQIVFFRHPAVPGVANYAKRGRYNNDERVTGIKP